MPITIKQIAEIAGVSAGTVDRALNNRGRIKKEVAENIKQIAKNLDYQPNTFASSLSNKRKKTAIAVISNVVHSFMFEKILSGISFAQSEIINAGIKVHIKYCNDFDAKHQLTLINEAVQEGVSGIVLVPINALSITARVNELHSQGFPIVCLTSFNENMNFLHYVGCSYQYSAHLTCGIINLISGGKANLAIFIPNLCMRSNAVRLEYIKRYIKTEYPNVHIISVTELSNIGAEAYIQTKNTLKEFPQIDTVLYSSGGVADGLIAIREAQQNTSLKVAVSDFSEEVRQALLNDEISFVIVQNPFSQGYEAVKLLASYIITKKIAAAKFVYINSEILIKESIKDYEITLNAL